MSQEPTDLSRLRIDSRRRRAPAGSRISALVRSLLWLGPFLLVGWGIARSFGGAAPEAPDASPVARESEQAAPSRDTAERKSLSVAAASAPVTEAADRKTLNATGYVVAQRSAAVSSKATGRLKELRVVEGDRVEEGQVLAVLENDDVAAAVEERRAQLKVMEAQVRAAAAELDDAGRSLARLEGMRKDRLVSESEFDTARFRRARAEALAQSQEASLEAGRASLKRSEVEFEYTFIRAPFSATVLTKDADIGEIVAPFGSSTNARAAVVTVADMSSLQIEADVSESNLTRVSVGQECEITLDSRPDRRYRGSVVKIVPTVDRSKATVLTKIRFLDDFSDVIPEMSAKITFLDSRAAQ